jgi:hypothetical protein
VTVDQATRHLQHLAGNDRIAAQLVLEELAWLRAELEQTRRLQTLGGPPPAYTETWENRKIAAGAHPDYRGRL